MTCLMTGYDHLQLTIGTMWNYQGKFSQLAW